jgi:hypothetical protein
MPGKELPEGEALNGDNITSSAYRDAVDVKIGVVGAPNGLAGGDFNGGELGSLEKVPVRRLDEYDVDFNDTREFCVLRWVDIVQATSERLTLSGIWLPRTNMSFQLTYYRSTNCLQIPRLARFSKRDSGEDFWFAIKSSHKTADD